MSSISGSNPLINTNIPTQVGSTTTSTQTTSTAPLYGDLGMPPVSVDMLGIVKPTSPEDSAMLLQQILEAVETQMDKSRGDQLKSIANSMRTALSTIASVADVLNNALTKIEKNNTALADINRPVFNDENGVRRNPIDMYEHSKERAGFWEGQRANYQQAANTALSNYQTENAKTGKDRNETLIQQYYNSYTSNQTAANDSARYRDDFNTWAHNTIPSIQTWLSGQGITVNNPGLSTSDYDALVVSTAKDQKQALANDNVTQQANYNAAQSVVLQAVTTLLTALKSVASDSMKIAGLVDANYAELMDLMTDGASKTKGTGTASWSNPTENKDSTPSPTVRNFAAALVAGLAEILSAIGEISELASTDSPGMAATNNRFRVAI